MRSAGSACGPLAKCDGCPRTIAMSLSKDTVSNECEQGVHRFHERKVSPAKTCGCVRRDPRCRTDKAGIAPIHLGPRQDATLTTVFGACRS